MEQGCSAFEPAESHSLHDTENPFGPSVSSRSFWFTARCSCFSGIFVTRHMTGFPFYFMAEWYFIVCMCICVCVCVYNIVYISHLFVGRYVGCCYLSYYEQYCNEQEDANTLRSCFHFIWVSAQKQYYWIIWIWFGETSELFSIVLQGALQRWPLRHGFYQMKVFIPGYWHYTDIWVLSVAQVSTHRVFEGKNHPDSSLGNCRGALQKQAV